MGHVACFFLLPFALFQLGESGLGKSTLVNSLFLTDLYKDRKLLNAEGKLGQSRVNGTVLRTSTLVPCFSSSYKFGWIPALLFVALLSFVSAKALELREKSLAVELFCALKGR